MDGRLLAGSSPVADEYVCSGRVCKAAATRAAASGLGTWMQSASGTAGLGAMQLSLQCSNADQGGKRRGLIVRPSGRAVIGALGHCYASVMLGLQAGMCCLQHCGLYLPWLFRILLLPKYLQQAAHRRECQRVVRSQA